MRADDDVGTDLCGRIGRADCQHSQALSQGDRGLMRHPGQLTASHHRNDRGGCGCIRHGGYRDMDVTSAGDRRHCATCGVSVDFTFVSFADVTIARLPEPVQPLAQRHHELIKFAIVGATTFVIDSVISTPSS